MKTIRDDLGGVHPAPTLRGGLAPDPDHPMTRAMVARISDSMHGGRRGCGFMILYAILVPIIVIAATVAANVADRATDSLAMAIVVWFVVLIGATITLGVLLTPSIHQPLALGLRWLGRCGCCCHPIVGAISTNGMTRCPECGAAWTTASIRDFHVADADVLGARRLRMSLRFLRAPHVRFADGRGRFVAVKLPKGRWMRSTPQWRAFRRARSILWTTMVIAGLVMPINVIFMVHMASTRSEMPLWPVVLVLGSFPTVLLFAIIGYPLIAIALLRRAGICPACANPLDAEKNCTACDAAWGAKGPRPLVTSERD